MYRVVEGPALRTTGARDISLRIQPAGEDTFDVSMEFTLSSAGVNGLSLRTVLSFYRVVYYEWTSANCRELPYNSGDVEAGLIELSDSPVIAHLRADTSFDYDEVICHYRICFNGHGCYDIVCESLILNSRPHA